MQLAGKLRATKEKLLLRNSRFLICQLNSSFFFSNVQNENFGSFHLKKKEEEEEEEVDTEEDIY